MFEQRLVNPMRFLLSAAVALCAMLSTSVYAQPVTATCKDGTAFTGASRSGACSGHGGVQAWGSVATGTLPSASTASPTTIPPTSSPANSTAAPGGGPGQVWVNTSSKVYHCSGDRWYGRTNRGEYMTEAQAKAAGNHADHNKACAQ
jgi:hypothetical protein